MALTSEQVLKNFKALNARCKRWDVELSEITEKARVQDAKITALSMKLQQLEQQQKRLTIMKGHGRTEV